MTETRIFQNLYRIIYNITILKVVFMVGEYEATGWAQKGVGEGWFHGTHDWHSLFQIYDFLERSREGQLVCILTKALPS